MFEALVPLVELLAAFALVMGVMSFLNHSGKNDHTLRPQRVPVRVTRRNRR